MPENGGKMVSLESKKLLILRILNVLEQFSDDNHPLTYGGILELLKSEYNIECERKAIGRNVSFLKEAGYSIINTKKGIYIENKLFESSEIRLLIDSVLASRHINEKHSKQLIDKLCNIGGHHFKKRNRNIKVSDWGKSGNISFFLNVEMIDEAIEKKKQIAIVYNFYGVDKKLHSKREEKYIINPYHMLLHNQRYYLVCNVDKYDTVSNFRIDRITGIEILNEPVKPASSLPQCPEGINPAQLSCEQPYMFTGEREYVVMTLDKGYINDIIDWFGDNFYVSVLDDNKVKVELKANISAMRYWALQYGTNIEIIQPHSLRDLIIEDIKHMNNIYKVFN